MAFLTNEKEKQYFKEQELLIRLKILAEERRAMAPAEKQRLKEQHWMHCPKCGQMLATEKYGRVDVDVCAGCKGLWLDAHELNAILASTEGSGSWRSFLRVLAGRRG